MNKSHAGGCCTALLALFPVIVPAQSVYKSTDGSGGVSYGDSPSQGAARVEQVEIRSGPTIDQEIDARRSGERIEASGNAMQAQRQAREQATGVKREARNMKADMEKKMDDLIEAIKDQGSSSGGHGPGFGADGGGFPMGGGPPR